MNQVTVPQFIENEDKILGPITVRQFVIMFSAAIILFLFYKFADFAAFIIMCFPIGGTAATFAFLKVNGQPFHFFILHITQTLKRPTLRVWKKSSADVFVHHAKVIVDDASLHPVLKKKLTDRKLDELSLIVDTGGAYMGERERGSELF